MPLSRRVGSLGSAYRASLGNSDGSAGKRHPKRQGDGEERRARVAQQLALGVLILAPRLCLHYRRCSFAPLAALSQSPSPRAVSDPRAPLAALSQSPSPHAVSDPRASTAPSAASASVGGPKALGRSSARRSEPLAVVAGGGFAHGCRIRVRLSKKVVNIGELRKLASQGIPDGTGIRSIVWKLLLGYLPYDREFWMQELAKKRSQYKAFKEEFLMNPIAFASQSEMARRMEESAGHKNEALETGGCGFLMRSEITHDEHPLSLGKTSVWNQFFQEALRHILIIFAKLNPGIRYVQGMNEILAPLFYVFRNDPDQDNAAYAEADAFFCFVELLSGFRDNFCQKLDNSVVGIRSTISKLSELLKKHDGELWRHLEITTKVNPQFYAFRWITLLLTQEFNFVDSLHIWDALLSDPDGPQETLLRVCCAMLILVRKRLLAGDFTSNLKLLQNYPQTNINHLLYVANKLRGSSAG
ncbi:TBC [Musa troglodytarum]|uniref:TBC n=1 Tax=Musa troglodytarum TaxID=320322 RepID=A0A9E7JKG6_9LILI|nr:TBC [Musa troglodytarum]